MAKAATSGRLTASPSSRWSYAGRLAARLRSSPRQRRRLQDAARFPRRDRKPVRQGATRLGDGPRRADRGNARRNARQRSTVSYLVGTPKGRLTRLEKQLVGQPWRKAREGVEVKLLKQDDDLYVFAQSADRIR